MPAPIVTYYEDDSTQATKLDFGTVDAGTDTKTALKRLYIWNNKAGGSAVSNMQSAKLSIVDKSGNKAGTVYQHGWVYAKTNDTGDSDVTTNATHLGKVDASVIPGNTIYTSADATEQTIDLSAANGTSGTGIIEGGTNGGASATDTANYCKVAFYVNIEANAPAGQHEFKLRTSYSYT